MLEKILNLEEQPVLALFGDEPAVDAQGILTTWATAWPRTIARVWKLEGDVRSILENLSKKQISTLPQYVKMFIEGEADSVLPALTCTVASFLLEKKVGTITPDLEKELKWYLNLRSNRTNHVASALMELGFINNSFMDNEEDGAWFFENVKIYIKNAEDGVALLSDDATTKNSIKYDVNKDDDERCLMEYCKSIKPYEREIFKKRLLYYNKQQRNLYFSIRNEVNDFIDNKQVEKKSTRSHFQYEIINEHKDIIDNLIQSKKTINNDDIIQLIDTIFEKIINEEIEINGWLNVRDKSGVDNRSRFINNKCEEDNHPHGKRTEHVVVLTIPRKPKNDEQIGIALTDYAAAGKTVPFTCCVCC